MTSNERHIVFVSPYSHKNSHSGARKRVEALCKALLHLHQNYRIRVTCFSPWLPPEGVFHIPFSLDLHPIRRLIYNLLLNIRIASLRPDLVISESPLAPIPTLGYKVFHVIHDAKFASDESRRWAGLTHCMHWISSRIATRVLTVSKSEKNRLIEVLNLKPQNIIVSYNGLSDEWYKPARNYWPISRKYDVLYVSNFAKHKRHIDLISIAKEANLCIAFVGADFGCLTTCKDAVARWGVQADFMSGLSESELIEVFDNSKSFAFPSSLEGFGMPFLEARARGLPVVAERLPVFDELQHLIGGSLIDFRDTDLAREKIIEAISEGPQPPDTRTLDFNWSSIATDLLKAAGLH